MKAKSYIPVLCLYAAPVLLYCILIANEIFHIANIIAILFPLYLTIISIWIAAKHKLKNPIIMLIPSMAALIICVMFSLSGDLGGFCSMISQLPWHVVFAVHFFSYGYMALFITAYHIETKIQQKRKEKENE